MMGMQLCWNRAVHFSAGTVSQVHVSLRFCILCLRLATRCSFDSALIRYQTALSYSGIIVVIITDAMHLMQFIVHENKQLVQIWFTLSTLTLVVMGVIRGKETSVHKY